MYLLKRIEAVLVKELNNMKVVPITHKHSTCGRNMNTPIKKIGPGKIVGTVLQNIPIVGGLFGGNKLQKIAKQNRKMEGLLTPSGGALKRKRKNAPSRKKSLGYYNKANKTGTGAKAGGGMSAKGVAKYRRDNPGSKLKTAVTTPPSKLKKGSKAAKRRKAFCARSKSWKSERGRAARRRWNC